MTTEKPKPPTLGEVIDAAIETEAARVQTEDLTKWNDLRATVRNELRHTPHGKELMKLRRSPLADQPADDIPWSIRKGKESEWTEAFEILEKWRTWEPNY